MPDIHKATVPLDHLRLLQCSFCFFQFQLITTLFLFGCALLILLCEFILEAALLLLFQWRPNNCFMQDPEFFQFLKEHDKELLEFNDEDVDVSL